MLIAGFALSAISYSVISRPLFSNEVTVWIYNVGQGSSALIDTGKEQVLIDGGDGAVVLEKLASTLPIWDRKIDYLVNTHPHADHVTGLVHVVEVYDVGRLLYDGQPYDSGVAEAFSELNPDPVMQGANIELAHGAELIVLWPLATPLQTLEDPNDSSVTLLFRAHGTSVLLTGDIGVDEERTMINEELLSDIDVLQVPHHGGNTSTSQALLEVTKPEVAIISVGQNNDYGHPHMDVLERIVSFGATVWRTDVHGDVRIKITENGYRVSGHAL